MYRIVLCVGAKFSVMSHTCFEIRTNKIIDTVNPILFTGLGLIIGSISVKQCICLMAINYEENIIMRILVLSGCFS